MPNWGYSSLKLKEEGIAKASGRDMKISPKAAREICRSIRHMKLDAAKQFLQDVTEMKKPVPYRRYSKKVGHKAGIQGWYAGRYPVKAARELLKILNGLEANATDRGLDAERLKIVHASSQRGRFIKRYTPRAFGRSSPKFDMLCHVELAVEEMR
ncbi:MAG: 50S ribosomal protein L22 [Candidatus Bathyarchaeota archaeon]